MSWVATAIVGSAAIGYLGSQAAAGKQADAANAANATQLSMFGVQQGNLKPFRDAGVSALGDINSKMPGWNTAPTSAQVLAQDPGYQFRIDQGAKALDNASSVRGGLVNAGTLASLGNYAQNQASSEYGNAFERYRSQINDSYNRIFGVANLGQTAASGVSAAGQNAGNNISSNQIGAGNAAASGYVGGANALTGAIGQGVQQSQYNSFLDRRFPQQPSMNSSPAPGVQYPQFNTNSEGVVSGLYD